jgi:hypothetical protein
MAGLAFVVSLFLLAASGTICAASELYDQGVSWADQICNRVPSLCEGIAPDLIQWTPAPSDIRQRSDVGITDAGTKNGRASKSGVSRRSHTTASPSVSAEFARRDRNSSTIHGARSAQSSPLRPNPPTSPSRTTPRRGDPSP